MKGMEESLDRESLLSDAQSRPERQNVPNILQDYVRERHSHCRSLNSPHGTFFPDRPIPECGAPMGPVWQTQWPMTVRRSNRCWLLGRRPLLFPIFFRGSSSPFCQKPHNQTLQSTAPQNRGRAARQEKLSAKSIGPVFFRKGHPVLQKTIRDG